MAKTKKRTKKKTRVNAPKLRSVGRTGTGWISARRVKIVRRGRRTEVLVEKGRSKKRR